MKKNLYYLDAVVAAAASVEEGVLIVVLALISVEVGVSVVVAGVSVVAEDSVELESLPLLQAVTDAAIANTKKSFFMFSVF
jgi:hypothetical protein